MAISRSARSRGWNAERSDNAVALRPLFHCLEKQVMHLHLRAPGKRIALQLILSVWMQVENGRIRLALHRPAARHSYRLWRGTVGASWLDVGRLCRRGCQLYLPSVSKRRLCHVPFLPIARLAYCHMEIWQ